MNNKNNILNHDYGYGLDINPNKIKKLHLFNINDLKTYIKDIVYTNIIKTNKISLEKIINTIAIEKIDYKIEWLN